MAEVYLGVGIDASGATQGASQFDNATNKLKSSAEKAQEAQRRLNDQLKSFALYAKAAAAAATYFAVRTISEYQTSLSAAAAVTKATAQEMVQLEAITRKLGATTMFSASQAAEGAKYLGMAGFETNQIIAALPATLDLAAAAQLDMGRAADITSNIMSGFGLAASEAGRSADVLAAIASSANTDVSGMGQAMKFVGPIAKSLGISMEDTAAAVGVLANAGIQGSLAGRNLRTELSSLVKPSKDARAALAEMGLTVNQVNPQMHGLQNVVKTLANAGLDAEKAFRIFGNEGATGMLALTGMVPELDKLTKVTNNAAGEAERMAKIMRDNIAGDQALFVSALSEMANAVGDAGLEGAVRRMLHTGTSFITYLSDLIKEMNDAKGAATLLRVAVEGLAFALTTLVAIKAATYLWGIAAAATAAAAAFLATPYGLVVAGMALIAGAIYSVYRAWESLPDLIGKSGSDLLMQINIVGAKALIYIRNFFVTVWDMGYKWAVDFGKNIKNAIINAWKGGLTEASNQLKADLYTMFEGAMNQISIPENVMNQMLKDSFDIDIEAQAKTKINNAEAGGIMLGKAFINGLKTTTAKDITDMLTQFVPGIQSAVNSITTPTVAPTSPTTIEPSGAIASPQDKGFFGAMSPVSSSTDDLKKYNAENVKLVQTLQASAEQERIRNQLAKDYGYDMEKVNLEMAIRNEQAKLSEYAIHGEAQAIREAMTAQYELKKATEAATAAKKKQEQAEKEWAQTMTYAFKDAIMNSKNLGDALSNLANRIQNILVNKALDSLLGGIFGGMFANGAAFSNGRVTAFASGGIVGTPTIFPMANGMGLMGEAGPEAIMPLTRTSDGALGVRATGGSNKTVIQNIVNVNVEGGSGSKEQNQDMADKIQQTVLRALDDKIVNVILREKRPGGSLA